MPKSLRCKIKHLCYNGTLTEKERDRILKALEQQPSEAIFDKIKAEIEKLNPVDYGSMYSYESHNGARDMKQDVLAIIDEYREEDAE